MYELWCPFEHIVLWDILDELYGHTKIFKDHIEIIEVAVDSIIKRTDHAYVETMKYIYRMSQNRKNAKSEYLLLPRFAKELIHYNREITKFERYSFCLLWHYDYWGADRFPSQIFFLDLIDDSRIFRKEVFVLDQFFIEHWENAQEIEFLFRKYEGHRNPAMEYLVMNNANIETAEGVIEKMLHIRKYWTKNSIIDVRACLERKNYDLPSELRDPPVRHDWEDIDIDADDGEDW